MNALPRVKKVLLCRPEHFTVDYVINPWMQPHSVDPKKAMQQWQALVRKLQELGINVEVVEQIEGLPDMVFATDQGIVRDGAVLLANFRYSQRQKERIHYRKWFRDNGYRLRALSNVFYFEGGDTLFLDGRLYVGTGFRASVSSCEELAQKLDIDVIPLRLVDAKYYHLDTCFLPLGDGRAFYYPPAFSERSRDLLKTLVPGLHEFTQDDVANFAANSFVSGTDIILQAGPSETLEQSMKDLGFKVHRVDVSEFNKAGGGIHCLINTLE